MNYWLHSIRVGWAIRLIFKEMRFADSKSSFMNSYSVKSHKFCSKNTRFVPVMMLLFLILVGCHDGKNQGSQSESQFSVRKDHRPNIILILTDDLGYADVGFNGSKDIKTPELDKLAKNGTIFSSAYVAHPFCGPSRAGLMTGVYPHTIGAQFNLLGNNPEHHGKGISLDKTFVSTILQDAGYYTAAVGKWHLGEAPEFHPNIRGFDDFYGFLGGGHSYFPKDYTARYQQQLAAGNQNIFNYLKPLEFNGEEVKDPDLYLTDELSIKAIDFIDKGSKSASPFFLYLAYNAPHVPLEAKQEDLKLFNHIEDDDRRTFAAMVYAVDRGVGQLANALKENHQFENTLIVFLSDNGGNTSKGGNNFPLKGRKGDTWEGGFRVPMFFHWPNGLPTNQKYAYPVSALDLYPTFANLTEAELPQQVELHGKNILNAVIDGKNAREGEPIFALRHREGYSDVGVRLDQWKATKTLQNEWQLIDVENDLSEVNNLSETYPEQLEKMVQQAAIWSKSHTEPQWFNPEVLKTFWKEKEMAKFADTFKVD